MIFAPLSWPRVMRVAMQTDEGQHQGLLGCVVAVGRCSHEAAEAAPKSPVAGPFVGVAGLMKVTTWALPSGASLRMVTIFFFLPEVLADLTGAVVVVVVVVAASSSAAAEGGAGGSTTHDASEAAPAAGGSEERAFLLGEDSSAALPGE